MLGEGRVSMFDYKQQIIPGGAVEIIPYSPAAAPLGSLARDWTDLYIAPQWWGSAR
jgi:hypothetical protein